MSKQGHLYDEWAAIAHRRGYPKVTGSTAHLWRRRGLLPAPIIRREGFGGTRSELPADAEARMTAICGYRYGHRIRDLAIVGTLTWLDGFEVEPARLRSMLRDAATYPDRELRRQGGRARASFPDDLNADIDLMAARTVHGGAVAATAGGIVQHEPATANALVELVSGMSGRVPADEIDPEVLDPLGLELGFGAAMSEAPEGIDPWLPAAAPGEHLLQVIHDLSVPALMSRLEGMADVELLEAREQTRAMSDAILPAAEFAGLVMRRGQYGLGLFRPEILGSPLGHLQMLWLSIALGVAVQPAIDTFAAMAAELSNYTELGRQWLADHPEHATSVAKVGLGQVLAEVANRR